MTPLGAPVEVGAPAPTGPPDVSVVVVSYNAPDWLPRCVASALAQARDGLAVEVVVVDNASTDPGVARWLAERPAGVRALRLPDNVGFARAVNLGVRLTRGRHILLLNPDAELLPGAAAALVRFLEADPARGIVGGRTVDERGTLDPKSCWGEPSLWSLACSAVGLSAVFARHRLFDPESLGRWQRDTEREVGIVTGCLLLASRATWTRLGGFDPDFFMYGEDADLSMRARRMGLRPSITPAAAAVHAVGASSGSRLSRQRMVLRGKATLVRKRWSPVRARVGVSLLQLGVGVRAVAEVSRRRPGINRDLWRERRDWSQGWPPAHDLPVPPGGADGGDTRHGEGTRRGGHRP